MDSKQGDMHQHKAQLFSKIAGKPEYKRVLEVGIGTGGWFVLQVGYV